MLKKFVLGPVSANCYCLINDSGECAVVDPGDASNRLVDFIKENGSELKYILLTHGHFDHIDGVAFLKESFPNAKIAIHEADEMCLCDDNLSLARGFGLPSKTNLRADIILHDGDILPFGDDNITVIHTPGHTIGGVTYKYKDMLFTGDTLFCRSLGRTDFPGGDYGEICASIRRLYALSGDYIVYPGHDRESTLNDERNLNPYVRGTK